VNVVERRAELLEALKDQAGEGLLVTDDPRQAVAPCILLHPVPTRNYVPVGDGVVFSPVWTIVAMISGIPDAAAADVLNDMQEVVEDALEPMGKLMTARPAAYSTRADMPANFSLVTTLED